ncbi:hypothetical protein EDD21DRAFT_385611 [Dissophora ornata]|nr:hypothetical protein EDD21DRAFT_385611 [Dissophora ornata]
MSTPGLAHSVPPLQTGAKSCSRCGKDFHLFRAKKNCYNCGSVVCESCSNFKAKLPQFGYTQEVRCCAYCAHFLQVSKLDYTALSKLNVKTLRGYLLSYNIPTQGMLEKQDLIQAIQSYKPIPEASEIYFRQHLPSTPEKSSSLFEELTGLGGSESPSGSSHTSSSSSTSSSGDGWSWDIDKFFSKLLGMNDRQSTPTGQTRQSRSQSQSTPGTQPPPQPQPQPQPQSQPRPADSTYRPQPRTPQSANTGTTQTNTYFRPSGSSSRQPAENVAPTPAQTRSPPPGHTSHAFNPRARAQAAQSTQPTAAGNNTATSSSQRQSSQSSLTQTLTLENLMSSETDPSTLSIKVIKALLDHSCVTYVGVVEKRDLVDRLQKLIDNTRAENEMIQEQEASISKKPAESSKPSVGGANEDDNLCKLCCDAALNCVMLNCNHMSTCMDCGKLIMEGSRMCPICREYVVRLLHVFRA